MNVNRNKEFWLEFILRYMLGIIMMAYGLIKIFEIQFVLPSYLYDVQLKDLDGVTLTWAFLGFSSWFSILLGLFEFIPAILLLFKRTKLIGAIMLFPVTINVFLVNIAYDFLPHMKVWTGVLLLINLFLLLSQFRIFRELFRKVLQSPPKNRIIESAVNIILIAISIVTILYYFK